MFWDRYKKFLEACEEGDLVKIKNLSKQIDVHRDNELGFRVASMKGRLDVVKYLYEICGCNPQAKNNYALYVAVSHNYVELVKYLCEKCCCDPHVNNDELFCIAAEFGHLDIVKYFYEFHKSNPHTCDERPLRMAAMRGHLKVLKYLVETCGCIPHLWDNYAIKEAARYGHLDCVVYLYKECGCNPRDNFTLSAAIAGGNLHIVEFLTKECNCDYSINDYEALRLSVEFGFYEIFKYLTETYGIPEHKSQELFLTAFKHGYTEICRYLLQYSTIDTTCITYDVFTLDYLLYKNKTEHIKFIINELGMRLKEVYFVREKCSILSEAFRYLLQFEYKNLNLSKKDVGEIREAMNVYSDKELACLIYALKDDERSNIQNIIRKKLDCILKSKLYSVACEIEI